MAADPKTIRSRGDPERHWQDHQDDDRSDPDEDGQDGSGDGRINAHSSYGRPAYPDQKQERMRNGRGAVAPNGNTPRYTGHQPSRPTKSSQPYSYSSSSLQHGQGQPQHLTPSYVTSRGTYTQAPSRDQQQPDSVSPPTVMQGPNRTKTDYTRLQQALHSHDEAVEALASALARTNPGMSAGDAKIHVLRMIYQQENT